MEREEIENASDYDEVFEADYAMEVPPNEEYQQYRRTSIGLIDTSHDLYLMQIDISPYTKNQKIENTQQNEEISMLKMYTITEQGNSILVHIRNFKSYFYIPCPDNFSAEDVENLHLLIKHLNERGHSIKNIGVNDGVRAVKLVFKENIRQFKGLDVPNSLKRFLKITTKSPGLVPKFRDIFKQGFAIENIMFEQRTFESNIPFVLRFMVDKDIVGMGWVKIAGGKYKTLKNHMSHCQLEIQCDQSAIEAQKDSKWDKIAPLRMLSFDIECNPQQGFPTEQTDQVITIACVCKTSTEKTSHKIVFSLRECSAISEAHVKSFNKQADLLLEFQKFLLAYDPDFILGYNIINFDLKYILTRAEVLKIQGYGTFGRKIKAVSKIKNGKYLSKAMGMRQTKEIDIDGRIQLDMMMHMHRQHKLSSYSLNNVSMLFLQERKEDVHHSELSKLFSGTADSRKRIAIYCLKDAELPLRLMEKLMCLYNYTEMARVTGVPLNFLFTRGQQIKVVSQIMRRAKLQNFILPTQAVAKGASDDDVAYEGAFVIDPKSGFYTTPIATLDFASLYPSIMMAHNLCYTTLVRKSNANLMGLVKDRDYIEKDGNCFVKASIKKGILPLILEDLIGARKRAKLELAKATDEMLKGVLEGRQLALKISANSVYGFTGATVGQLPCLEISSTVTSFGREMIHQTKDEVLKNFQGSDVIYGDTDSVMVKFRVDESQSKQKMREQAMNQGRKAAAMISKCFPPPIKLEFQKVYSPYLLVTKKRYAGLLYTKPQKWDKLDKKGLQSVRRDNCQLIRTMLQQVLRIIMIDQSIADCTKYIKGKVTELLQNKIDIGELVITKAITKKTDDQKDEKDAKKKQPKNTYKVKQAHVELAEKMKKRDGGNGQNINIGDRIPYVMIKGVKGSKNFENAEDPRKVLMEDIPIDFDYYIEKQIKPPLQRLLKDTMILHNFDSLFIGDHTKNRYIPKVQYASLGQFLVRKSRCVGCQVVSEEPVCQECRKANKIIDLYLEQKLKQNEINGNYSKYWSACQQCMGYDLLDIICENMDCKIFYKRIKVRKELEEQRKIMARFKNLQG